MTLPKKLRQPQTNHADEHQRAGELARAAVRGCNRTGGSVGAGFETRPYPALREPSPLALVTIRPSQFAVQHPLDRPVAVKIIQAGRAARRKPDRRLSRLGAQQGGG